MTLGYGDTRHSFQHARVARAILVGLAALLWQAPLPAVAQSSSTLACGAIPGTGSPPVVTCDRPAYPNGIEYIQVARPGDGNTRGLTLSIEPGDGGTTITNKGIKFERTNTFSGPVRVNVGTGTIIGTMAKPLEAIGIHVNFRGGRKVGDQGKMQVTNAGSIVVRDEQGIKLERFTPGDIELTNSGSIVSQDSNPTDRVRPGGMLVRIQDKGNLVINHSGSVTSGWHAAIYGWHTGSAGANEGSIKITSSGTVRSMAKHGILAEVRKAAAAVPATVTVTGGVIRGTDDGIRVANKGNGSSTVRVSGSARIESSNEDGIHASAGEEGVNDKSKAAVLIDFAAGSRIITLNRGEGSDESSHGILAEHQGNQALAGEETDTGSITIDSAGAIRTAGSGHGIAAFATGATATVPVTVNVSGGSITAPGHGIHVENKGKGKIAVTVGEKAMVKSERDGIHIDGALLKDGIRAQEVTVRGKVMGGDGTYAGLHMVNGGTVVVGPKAHVSAASGVAIKANAAGDMTVILEKDEDGVFGWIDGRILNAATTTFQTRVGASGAATPLAVGGMVTMFGETKGVYDEVHRSKLTTITGSYDFEKMSSSRLYHDRARVYEALPAVLLDLNGQTPYRARMAAPRDSNGGWARLMAGDGARRPASSTTGPGLHRRRLAWDVSQYGLEAGLDLPVATKGLLLGVSLHARQGEATVEQGGTIEVSGFGGGGSATYRDEAGFYLDGRVSYTYFNDIDLSSRTRGAVKADLSGHGYAFGLEAGRRLVWAGLDSVALTPRARVVWSSVDLEDFDDVADIPGSGRVALETATSFKGRLGVLAETEIGKAPLEDLAGAGGRLFASLDVEQEFLVDRELRASGTALASEVRATWGRVGVGGAFSWNEGQTTLSGEGFYATAGSGNTDFGGSLALTVHF